jgi:hypothetical protein
MLKEAKMDIGKSFGYVFEDDQWIPKILIAAAILLGGILFFWLLFIPSILAALLLAGYGVEITRRVINRNPQILPEWENWEALIVDGLKYWIISIVYSLPMLLIWMCLGIPGAALSQDAPGWSAAFNSVAGCLNFLWSIVVGILMPAAIAFFVANDDLGAAFRFGDVFNFVRDNFSNYLIVLVMSWVTGIIGFLGFLLCLLPVLVTGPYSGWVMNHLYGEAYLDGMARASQPVLEESA